MKKLILVLVVFAVVSGSAFADFEILSFPPSVQGGSIMIDAGIGLRALGLTGHKMTIPPLFVQGEYALPVGVPISVGAGISFGQWKWDYWGWGYKVTYITPHFRANWHWGFDISWLDFYTGMSMGADIASVKWNESWMDNYTGSGTAKSRFFWAFQAGAHFYFSEHVGAMVETGYPYWLKAGIALKFGEHGSSGGGDSSKQSTKKSKTKAEYMLVNADSLNVREGPSSDTKLVGAVKKGTRVQVLEKPGQWWKIKAGDIEGYVNSSYLSPES
jgi:uncharacterized protein YgiM (DUF1202 family)